MAHPHQLREDVLASLSEAIREQWPPLTLKGSMAIATQCLDLILARLVQPSPRARQPLPLPEKYQPYETFLITMHDVIAGRLFNPTDLFQQGSPLMPPLTRSMQPSLEESVALAIECLELIWMRLTIIA
jgi:hypothetical protein